MGGIIPPLARFLHEENIKQVHKDAMRSAGIHPRQLDAVAVTTRPGLSLSLKVLIVNADDTSITPFYQHYYANMYALSYKRWNNNVITTNLSYITLCPSHQ